MHLPRTALVAGAIVSLLITPSLSRADLVADNADDAQDQGQLIEGMVLTHDGAGIADATIRLESLDASSSAKPLATGTTNEIGDISVRLPEPVSGPIRIRIQADGFQEYVQEVDPTETEYPPFVDVILKGAATITGTIKTSDGQALPDETKVECSSLGRSLPVEVEPSGEYRIKDVYRGSTTLEVSAPGYARQRLFLTVDKQQIKRDITLEPELPIRIQAVTDKGDPARELTIEATVEPGNTYLYTMTDEQGQAELKGISINAEKIQLRCNGPDYIRMRGFDETISLATTQPARKSDARAIRHRIVVKIGAAIKGKVISQETRQPIVGIRVVTGREQPESMVWTAVDGSYEIRQLAPGQTVVSFQSPDFATNIKEVHLDPGKTGTVNAKMSPGQPIAGIVVDPDGTPIEQAWVSAERWRGYKSLAMRTVTDDQGRFELPHAPPGEIDCVITKPGFALPVTKTFEAGRTDYRITLEPAELPSPRMMPDDAALPLNESVPEFKMIGTDGTVYDNKSLQGRYVFLDFWASWCGPCAREMANVKKLRDKTRDRSELVIIGVSVDEDRDDFKAFVDRFDMDWPLVFGPESGAEETFVAFDGLGLPYTCLIGPEGKLLEQHMFGSAIYEKVLEHLNKSGNKSTPADK